MRIKYCKSISELFNLVEVYLFGESSSRVTLCSVEADRSSREELIFNLECQSLKAMYGDGEPSETPVEPGLLRFPFSALCSTQ